MKLIKLLFCGLFVLLHSGYAQQDPRTEIQQDKNFREPISWLIRHRRKLHILLLQRDTNRFISARMSGMVPAFISTNTTTLMR